jgi:hypothetical protein
MGANWTGMGANWFGANWFGANWTGSGPGSPIFPMRADQPLAAYHVTPDFNAQFRKSEWDPDLLALEILPQFVTKKIQNQTWDQKVTIPPPTTPITQAMIDELLAGC